jgi:hypothetical protein
MVHPREPQQPQGGVQLSSSPLWGIRPLLAGRTVCIFAAVPADVLAERVLHSMRVGPSPRRARSTAVIAATFTANTTMLHNHLAAPGARFPALIDDKILMSIVVSEGGKYRNCRRHE